ncbi:MAG: hypothetical protein WBA43_17220 [Elainellaceae cyanobacterium]
MELVSTSPGDLDVLILLGEGSTGLTASGTETVSGKPELLTASTGDIGALGLTASLGLAGSISYIGLALSKVEGRGDG